MLESGEVTANHDQVHPAVAEDIERRHRLVVIPHDSESGRAGLPWPQGSLLGDQADASLGHGEPKEAGRKIRRPVVR